MELLCISNIIKNRISAQTVEITKYERFLDKDLFNFSHLSPEEYSFKPQS